MLAEAQTNPALFYCVSFIVEHHATIWEEKQHGPGAAGELGMAK